MSDKPRLRKRIDHYLRKKRKGLIRLKGPLQKSPELIHLATTRPINLPDLSKQILKIRSTDPANWLQIIEDVIVYLGENRKSREEAANIFVALIRATAFIDADEAIDIGMKYIDSVKDERAMKSLTNLLLSKRRKDEAWRLLQKFQNSQWSIEKREELLRKEGLGESLEENYLNFIGRNNLETDFRPAVLLYGDLDMNLIDGSSIWLASLTEVFTKNDVEIHLLLKSDLKRKLLLNDLIGLPEVKIIEPRHFGIKNGKVSAEDAIQLVEILDGIQGGYKAIILRGLEVCIQSTGYKSLWKRTYPYLTDYYSINEDGKRAIKPDAHAAIPDLGKVAGGFFVQTPELAEDLKTNFSLDESQLTILPPMIPDSNNKEHSSVNELPELLKIGYSGKIAPFWGIRELIESTDSEFHNGRQIQVHIIGDKIHSDTPEYPNFNKNIRTLLEESPHVIWHGGLEREKAIEIMNDMDVAWCYRSPLLESETLEVSTKLIENMQIALPMILTRNSLNEKMLGKEYPLFVDGPEDIGTILGKVTNGNILSEIDYSSLIDAAKPYVFSSIRSRIIRPFVESLFQLPEEQVRRILLNGHDLKFIGEFESYLKRKGHIVRRDRWDWGQSLDSDRGKSLLKWAEIVFSEWGLANSVWYSNHISPNQHHVVRIHLQEINDRAKMFPLNLDHAGVDTFVFVADHVRDAAQKMFGWDESKTILVPNYVDVDRMEHSKLPNSNKTLGIIGIIPQRKRLDRALNLLSQLRESDSDWKLIIKGNDPRNVDFMQSPSRSSEMEYYNTQFARMENNPRLRDAVKWEGHTLALAPWYRKIQYVLSPSDFESFHYSIADGVASGSLPILWPWDGSEDIYHEDWVIENTHKAVEKIKKLSQSDYSEQLVENRKLIRKEYGIDKIFPQLEKAMGLVD